MEKNMVKQKCKLSLISIWCVAIAVILALCFFIVNSIGLDLIGGVFVLAVAIFFALAFIFGIFSCIVLTLRFKYLSGWAYAISAILLSSVPIYFLCGIWMGAKARIQLGKAHVGTYNLKTIGEELRNYANANDGRLPAANEWCDVLIKQNLKLSEATFRHPQSIKVGLEGQCHFAFNKNLSGMFLDKIPKDVVLLFEADGDWNLNGGSELLKSRYDPESFITLLFVSGKCGDYWFEKEGVRKIDKNRMSHVPPRWIP